MPRLALALSSIAALSFAWPGLAHAGGPEFPAGGTRSLGRGAAAFVRADDPSVMVRNPALLAELWDDQAIIGAHLAVPDACFQPTGYYAWDALPANRVAYDFGEGPRFLTVPAGATLEDGTPIVPFGDDPFPELCYEGPAPFLPHVGLSMKLNEDLGVGFGFFPPDSANLLQWGNRDGTVDTPNGRLPNPVRFYRSHMNVSFFTLLGAVGYRLADWISIGAGFQWNLAVFSALTWTTPQAMPRPYHNDIRTEVFGRDLFIPGVIASVTLHPIEPLDIAIGFKWSDRITSKGKLDITTGAWGTGEITNIVVNDMTMPTGSSIPTTSHNQPGVVDSPPIWAPQLSLGVRFADRLRPKPRDRAAARVAAGRSVEDHMLTERWDIEFNAVYYFNSVFDQTSFTNSSSTRLVLRNIDALGNIGSVPSSVGQCLERDPETMNCIGDRLTQVLFAGKDQLSLRLGGDYNVLPGLLAVRGGVSYETDGQEVEYLNLLFYMLGRTGVHAGFTLRIAEKTDISFGFAHFFQKNVRLQVNTEDAATYRPQYKTARYHFQPGRGVDAAPTEIVPDAVTTPGDFDGNAMVDVPNGDALRTTPGPHFVNAGSYYFHLDVFSLTFTQHF
jgi:long-subunit fatty acid transport protein